MNSSLRDTTSINTIPKNNWIDHYKLLWNNLEKEALVDIGEINVNVDLITMREFQKSLQNLKNRKATGINSINLELIKYGENFFTSTYTKPL